MSPFLPNPRLQRTGLRSPLSRKPLCDLSCPRAFGVLLLVSWPGLISCATSVLARAVAVPVQPAPAARDAFMLRRQPGGMLISGNAMNFWNIQIAGDGSAALSAQGTPLIQDGDYKGMVPPDLLQVVRSSIEQLRSTPATIRICMHASDFQVYASQADLFRNACISEVNDSNLAALFRASEQIIRETAWTFVSPRPAL
jgi:hypothetical protein